MRVKGFATLFFIGLALLLGGCEWGTAEESVEKGLQRLPQEAQAFHNEDRIAVIAGIDQYHPNSGFRSLHFAVKDAQALADVLSEQGYTVKLLLNSDAKKHFILQAIDEAGKLLDAEQGTLIFAFTGHGFADNDKTNYLAVDGTSAFDLRDSGLSLDRVKTTLRESGARRSMLFIDACRDNPVTGKSVSNPGFLDLADSEGLNILYSTAQGDVSYEHSQFQHGLFSYFLLEGLQGKAAREDGLILFGDLANYVTQEVKTWSFKHLPKAQKPYRAGESSGEFLVAALSDNDDSRLAQAFEDYDKGGKEKAAAIETIKELSDNGNVIAKAQLASFYFHGTQYFKKDVELAEKLARQALDGLKDKAEIENNAYAQIRLGVFYEEGMELAKDNEKAVKWYRKAAEQGHAKGQYNLGLMYKDGKGVKQDYKKASEWCRKAAKQDYALAQAFLGLMYEFGKGVEKDDKKSDEWLYKAWKQFKKSAEHGDAANQRRLGAFYESGWGVEKNYDEAIKWYRKAAEQGNARGQNSLGEMYYRGNGVEKDYNEAIKWYRKAAEQGNSYGQRNLGRMYEDGLGDLPQDYKQALYWYKKAKAQEHKNIDEDIQRVEAKLQEEK